MLMLKDEDIWRVEKVVCNIAINTDTQWVSPQDIANVVGLDPQIAFEALLKLTLSSKLDLFWRYDCPHCGTSFRHHYFYPFDVTLTCQQCKREYPIRLGIAKPEFLISEDYRRVLKE